MAFWPNRDGEAVRVDMTEVEYISGESGYLGAELVKGYIKGVHSKNVHALT